MGAGGTAASSFAVAGVSEAGWKHPVFIGCLFLLSALFLLVGIGWPWIRDISLELQGVATRVAQNPVSWLAMLITGLSWLWLINKTNEQSEARKPRKIPTGLSIEFVPGQSALASRIQNIWHWYPLSQIRREVDQNENSPREPRTVTIFVTFDRPVDAQQIFVTSEGGPALPMYEVKDWSVRHAIVVFVGYPAGCTVGIRAGLQLRSNAIASDADRRFKQKTWLQVTPHGRCANENGCVRTREHSALERDDFSSNRHPALAFWWSMIFSENPCPLFGIMLLGNVSPELVVRPWICAGSRVTAPTPAIATGGRAAARR